MRRSPRTRSSPHSSRSLTPSCTGTVSPTATWASSPPPLTVTRT
nr:MAG TPA: hypothetical protein [Caudoviricetes sp.]